MIALVLAALLAAAPAAPAAPPSGPAAPGRARHADSILVIDMSRFRNDRGAALVAVFTSPSGFPDHPEHAFRRVAVRIRKGRARAILRRVPPGIYAVAVLHDEDGDHKMKTGWFGIPKEGFGASRDARGRFGPPHFRDARFAVAANHTVTVPVHMTYY